MYFIMPGAVAGIERRERGQVDCLLYLKQRFSGLQTGKVVQHSGIVK